MNECVTMPREDYQAICDTIREASGKTNLIKSGDLSAEVSALANQIGKIGFKSSTLVGVNANDFDEIVYGNGNFVGCNQHAVYHSNDGSNWTKVSLPSSSNVTYIRGLSYCNGKFILSGVRSILTSADGVSWHVVKSHDFFYPWAFAYGNGMYVAIGNNNVTGGGYNFAYSSDGLNWTYGAIESGFLNFYKVFYDGKKFITYNNGKFYTSTDGKTWTQLISNFNFSTSSTFQYCGGDGKYAALVESDENYQIMFSTDLINWTIVKTFPRYEGRKLAYYNGTFITVNWDANCCSTDGINWSEITSLSKYEVNNPTIGPSSDGCLITSWVRIDYSSNYIDTIFFHNPNDAGIW